MANKITQLVNESGDNLYPLAGGMAADSIDTEMLKDGSVTSDKIDSATYTYSEQKIGVWVNGKPIYRRLVYGTLPSGGSNVLLDTLPNSSVPLHVEGWGQRNSIWTSLIGSYGSSISSIVQVYTNGEVRAYYDSVFVGGAYNLYIEYVKNV